MNQPQLVPQPVSAVHGELAAFRIVSLAELLQLIPEVHEDATEARNLREALAALRTHGVGKAMDKPAGSTMEVRPEVVEQIMDSIESSPMPELEWSPLTTLLGEELLSGLTGISETSVRRYRNAERTTPDAVAARLHFTALVVADLLGSYNVFGVRRWFARPRAQLHGRTPLMMLGSGWTPEDQDAMAVRELAAALLAPLSS